MPVSVDEVLRRARLRVNATLTDRVLNERTATTQDCRVSIGRSTFHAPDAPAFIRVKAREIRLRDDAERPVAGDILTVTGKGAGSYSTMEILGPTTISVDIAVVAAQLFLAPDGARIPMPPNEVVTFKNPAAFVPVDPITTSVYLFPLSNDDRMLGEAVGSTHGVVFDPSLRTSDGKQIDKGWQIYSDTLGVGDDGSSPAFATLNFVRRQYGELAIDVGFFDEAA